MVLHWDRVFSYFHFPLSMDWKSCDFFFKESIIYLLFERGGVELGMDSSFVLLSNFVSFLNCCFLLSLSLSFSLFSRWATSGSEILYNLRTGILSFKNLIQLLNCQFHLKNTDITETNRGFE